MISGCSSPMIAQALSGTLLRQRMTMSFRSSFGITSNFRRIVSLLGGRTWFLTPSEMALKNTMLEPLLFHWDTLEKRLDSDITAEMKKKVWLNRTEQEVSKTANSEKWTDEKIDQLFLEQSKRFSRIQRMNCVKKNNLPENYWELSDSERQDLRDRIWKEVKSEETQKKIIGY